MDANKVLEEVGREVATCQKCDLQFTRKKAVPGEGPADASIMFVGEGPGFYENEQGRPFVGAAGKFLDELLAVIQLKREGVFITNVVKCRPPGNRDPLPGEIEICTSNYLNRQIQAINPKVIVTLGRYSMGLFLPDGKTEIVGMIVVWLIIDEAHIATLAVHPDHRGQGIGRRLLFTALNDCVGWGAHSATLEVRQGNLAAQTLYKDFGFEIVGRRPHYYIDNNEDALIMTLEDMDEEYLDWLGE